MVNPTSPTTANARGIPQLTKKDGTAPDVHGGSTAPSTEFFTRAPGLPTPLCFACPRAYRW